MKWTAFIALAFVMSCSGKAGSENTTTEFGRVPASGTYRYDMAFAEWDGKSMGEKVTVIVTGDSIRVVYEGDGTLTAEKGEILEEGRILKHKSGAWIIAHHEHEANLDEIGGCSDGPRIIDFKNQKFWFC
jgi:hypothetical protein